MAPVLLKLQSGDAHRPALFRQQLESVIDVADYDDVLFLYGIDSFVNADDIYMLKFLYKPATVKMADS